MNRFDLIQTVCQLYDVVEGERIHLRKTALIQDGSPLHPHSVCNPNYGGHELCLPLTVDYVSSEFPPPTMAHHFYYLHVRDAKIPISLKTDIYRQLFHTAPSDLRGKYTEFESRFDLLPLKGCRLLMVSIVDFWIQRCKRLQACLDATEFFPIRLQWTDVVFEGTRLEHDQLSQNWKVGREIDEYGWAIEMARAKHVGAFTENCPLIFMGDNTSLRLARYIEWGKRFCDIDGRLLQHFGIDSWKLEECDRMSTLLLLLQKVHFGNGCIAVVLSSGEHELAEGMTPSKYGKLLNDILVHLLQFQLRILVTPPTPNMKDQFLWFQYVQQQVELSAKLSAVEFLIRPTRDRCFFDAVIIGSHTLDSFMCDDVGFTDFGIKKLGFFLIEVMQIPRTGHNRQISRHETITATNQRRDNAIFAHDYGAAGIVNVEQQSVKLFEAQTKVWYEPNIDYKSTNLLPTSISYFNVKNYSELAGYAGQGSRNLLVPLSNGIPNSRHQKKKTKITASSYSQKINNGHLRGQEQLAMINSDKLGQSSKSFRRNYFTISQERRDRRKRARARRAAERLNK